MWNRPFDPDLCSQSDVLVRAQFDAHARLFFSYSQIICTVLNSVGRQSCHRASKTYAWWRSCDVTTANMAEVLKLAAKPVQHDNDEKTWLEFRFKLENYLTLVDEKFVALLQDAGSQAVAGAEEPAVTIRTLSHTLYALLATLTTGRSLRLVQRVPNRNGLEAWRQLVAENAPKTAGLRFAMLQAVLQPGMSDSLAKFEETWKS